MAGPLRPPPFNEIDPALSRRFGPSPTPLWQLAPWSRKRLLHIVLLILATVEDCQAYSRILLHHLTSSLHLPLRAYLENESQVARGLGLMAAEFDPEDAMQRFMELKAARKAKVGPQVIQPYTPPDSTSPRVMSDLGTRLGPGQLGEAAASGLLGFMSTPGVPVAGLFGIYLAKTSVKSIEAYAKDVVDFGFVPLHDEQKKALRKPQDVRVNDRRMHLTFVMNGWLTEEEEVTEPWKFLGRQSESYVIRWETATLFHLGAALETAVGSAAWAAANKELHTKSGKLAQWT